MNYYSIYCIINVLILISFSTSFSFNYKHTRLYNKNQIDMKWMFGKIPGSNASFKDYGGVGGQGELYYIPASKPSLKAPKTAIGKEITIPLFPRNQVLGPTGEDYLLIYEMRYRQLFNDVGDGGLCGHIFYSQENSRLALVGTLSKVTKLERLDDGGMYLVMQGIGRFYVRDIIAEKPYLKAKVQLFYDYTDNIELVESLEKKVFSEIRYSVKIMKLLYPQNNYTMNEYSVKYRPNTQQSGIRTITLPSDVSEMQKHSRFSFGTMEMLKTDAPTKLVFIQEPVIERRLTKMLKILDESTSFLESELIKRGTYSDESVKSLKSKCLSDTSDLELSTNTNNNSPSNFIDGDWKLTPNLM